MKKIHAMSAVAAVCLLVAPQGAMATEVHKPVEPKLLEAYGKVPLSFEANNGQADPQVKFLSRGPGYSLFLTATEAVLGLRENAIHMKLVGASRAPRVSGFDPLPSRSNYFIGNDPTKWRTNIPHYAKVKYSNVYPGIDLIYYGNQRQLEYDLEVAPGADPHAIVLTLEGSEKLAIDAQGDVVVRVAGGDLRLRAPQIYQEVDGRRQSRPGRYVLNGSDRVGIQVAHYDSTKPLIVDPILVYSTYLGGSSPDTGRGIAVDSSGNAYVVGQTAFFISGPLLPTTPGAFQTFPCTNVNDAYVTKFNPSGSALIYSTYLGGCGQDIGIAIAVDAAGNAYVTGTTDANFPTTASAFQGARRSPFFDGFVTKLNSTGSALLYSTYLGGGLGINSPFGIAADNSGAVYVSGSTNAADFPTFRAFQPTLRGFNSAFVTKIDTTQAGAASLVYSTFLGGTNVESANGIAVDGAGNAYVTGVTRSSDFPTLNAYQTSLRGTNNAFVTRLDTTKAGAASLVYSTYFGGNGTDSGVGIAVDGAGQAYVTGFTSSTNFPTLSALQTTLAGPTNAFVAKLDTTKAGLTSLVYSTYLGGNGGDGGAGIAVDAGGNAYVSGGTSSANFPMLNAFQSTLAGTSDAFVAKLNPSGSGLVYSTYLGGNLTDGSTAIALERNCSAKCSAYVVGDTTSTLFPTTAGAFQTLFGGQQDAFVAKISGGDGVVGPSGGTVSDSAGSGAVFSVPAGVLTSNVVVSIDVIANPGVSPPPGFLAPATQFVSITLDPNPSPLPTPGASITLPLAFSLPPGTALTLFKFIPPSSVTSTGIVGTVNPGGTTATFSGVTTFSIFVALQPGNVPFAMFNAKAEIELSARPNDDQFEVKGGFTLGSTSNGINPPSETVKLQVGTFSTTIPAGSFTQDKKGRFKFEGTIKGVTLEFAIRPLGGNSCEFEAEGKGANFTGTMNPVTVTLTIGDDSGSTTVIAEFE